MGSTSLWCTTIDRKISHGRVPLAFQCKAYFVSSAGLLGPDLNRLFVLLPGSGLSALVGWRLVPGFLVKGSAGDVRVSVGLSWLKPFVWHKAF